MARRIENPFSNHPRAINWSENNEESPDQVSASSKKVFLFDCPDCGHEFKKPLYDVTVKNKWCQYCAKKALCGDINCEMCLNQSFASCEKAEFWSEENELAPHQVSKGSKCKFLFDCPDCGHEFEKSLESITGARMEWCPYCNGQGICEDVNCEFCLNKSFASTDRAQCWGRDNEISARSVCKNSNTKFYFDCDTCGHTFDAQPSKVMAGSWCCFCANLKLCGDENCQTCLAKSFASHPESNHWSNEKNDCSPKDVFRGTKKKYVLVCNNCNNDTTIAPRDIINDQWCRNCN